MKTIVIYIAISYLSLGFGFLAGLYTASKRYWAHLDRDIESMRFKSAEIDLGTDESAEKSLIDGVTY